MSHNKINDGSGYAHATQPDWPDSDHVRTMCAYEVPVGNTTETTEFMNCPRCCLALFYLHEQADKLNKAITFARREALFEGDMARRGGTPSPWAKLSLHEITFAHRMAADLFRVAVANELPIETVIRAASRLESLRLEMATFPPLPTRGNQ